MTLFEILDVVQYAYILRLLAFGIPIPRIVSTLPLGVSIGVSLTTQNIFWSSLLVAYAAVCAPISEITIGIFFVHFFSIPIYERREKSVIESEKGPSGGLVASALRLSKQRRCKDLKVELVCSIGQAQDQERPENPEKYVVCSGRLSQEDEQHEDTKIKIVQSSDRAQEKDIAERDMHEDIDDLLVKMEVEELDEACQQPGVHYAIINLDALNEVKLAKTSEDFLPSIIPPGMKQSLSNGDLLEGMEMEIMYANNQAKEDGCEATEMAHDPLAGVDIVEEADLLMEEYEEWKRLLEIDLTYTGTRAQDELHQDAKAKPIVQSNQLQADNDLPVEKTGGSHRVDDIGQYLANSIDVEGSPLEIHLHELRILSRSDHVDFRRVLSLYCTIEKCMRGEDSFPFPYDPDWIDRSVDEGLDSAYSADDAAKFCTAIESGKLIYIPGGKGDGTWLSSSQCTWKGENLRYSTAIHKYYGGNQHTTSLFRHILSVPDVGDHHLLKELDGLRVNDSGAHFQNVFLALNKFLVEAPVDAETRAIETFQNKSIFPVSTGDRPSSIEKYLKNYPKEDAEPEWYIAMTLRHEQCFKGVVPLLDFDFAFNARLNKLLNRFKSFHGHNLDLDSKGLTPILDPRGYQRLDTKYTDFLRKKAPFITRLVGTNFYDSRANVTSLSSLKVYSAPSLFVSYELGYGSNAIKSNSVPCSAGYSRKITRRNHGELKIYLLQDHLRDSHYKFQFELADVLEELCGTKAHFAGLMYLVLTERNERHVEEQFRRRGVPEITSAMEPEFFSPEDEQHVQKNLSSSAESRHKRKRPRRKAKARAAEQ